MVLPQRSMRSIDTTLLSHCLMHLYSREIFLAIGGKADCLNLRLADYTSNDPFGSEHGCCRVATCGVE
jgi:hypothetical protein